MESLKTLEYKPGVLRLLDQTRLPGETVYMELTAVEPVVEAIKRLSVRGAPAIGVTAAYAMCLSAHRAADLPPESFAVTLEKDAAALAASRPTAVNLFWAIGRMLERALAVPEGVDLKKELLEEAKGILEEDIAANRTMGILGQALLPEKCSVLSHCNAGALATGGFGTALGVIRAARERGKEVKVFLDETRPILQGARLSSWELAEDGFDVTVICDSMAGALMRERKIDAVIVGADRIASNGDVANKIGTYSLAVLAKEHWVPFYVAAPWSTFDTSLASGEDIIIEERSGEEVRLLPGGKRIPDRIKVWNPAFDVTPAALVTAIISEKGIFRAPYDLKDMGENDPEGQDVII